MIIKSLRKHARQVPGAFLLAALSALAGAQAPTAEQLRRFEQLSPQQQSRLLQAVEGESSSITQTPLEQPRLVVPMPYGDDVTTVAPIGYQEAEPVGPPSSGSRSRDVLQPFGYDLFAGAPTTFAPATDIPIDMDYVLGPGDTVKIQLFGKEPAEYSLVVSREGQLHFPKLGPVTVAGLTFGKMQEVIQAHIARQMIGEQAVVTLGALRSIRVFVLGDANRPGSYTVSALSTLTNALFVSGGIKPIGSLRNIQLKRNGKLVARFDLYDLLLRGDTSGDTRLQPGDVIFIPPAGKTAGVAGEVRRPAIYELKNENRIEQVLTLAGGLLPTAYPQASQIERINKQGERTLVDVDISNAEMLRGNVQAGDTLRIYSILEKMDDIVLLSGHVQRPGGYQWHPGMRVSELVPSIQRDLLPRPDLDYALVRREVPPDQHVEVLSIRLGEAVQHPGSAADIELHSRDELLVFDAILDRTAVVSQLVDTLKEQATFRQPARVAKVGGLVRHPGEYPLEASMRVSSLIRAGGGLAEAAYALGAELTRYEVVDGSYREVAHVDVDLKKILAGDRAADLALRPYDDLHIKRLPEWATAVTVEIRGEVRFPGIYPISRGEQLSSLLQRAGGLTDMAFPQGAVFLRKELQERERQRIEEMTRRLEADLASLSLKLAQEGGGQADTLGIVRQLGDQLRGIEPTGRLVINLPELLEDTRKGRRSDFDVTLNDSDKLYVPAITQEVTVTGEVFYPTSHLYTRGFDRDRYVKLSGGVTGKADAGRIYVIRADGSVGADESWFSGDDDVSIRPGDTIVVPLDVDRVRPINLWTNVSQIIYQLAIAAASAHAVGVF